jgi:hypothetical protein
MKNQVPRFEMRQQDSAALTGVRAPAPSSTKPIPIPHLPPPRARIAAGGRRDPRGIPADDPRHRLHSAPAGA